MIKQATINLKTHKKYNLLFFILLTIFFIILYLSNALILSLESLKIPPLISAPTPPFLKAFIQTYQKFYQAILFGAFLSFYLFCLGRAYVRRKETEQALLSGRSPLNIALVNATESFIVFSYFIVIYLIVLLVFQPLFERLVIYSHSLMAQTMAGVPTQLEKMIQSDVEEQFVVRMTNTKQIFEYLLYFSKEDWSRLFLTAYIRTIVGIAGCILPIHLLVPWIYATWKKKKS